MLFLKCYLPQRVGGNNISVSAVPIIGRCSFLTFEGCNDITLTGPKNPNSFSSNFLFVCFVYTCSLRNACFDLFYYFIFF